MGPIDMPKTEDLLFKKALDRLRVSNVKPELQGLQQGMMQERDKSAARDKKIAKFLRSKGVSPELLNAALAIK